YFAVWSANASHGCPNDFNAADLNALIVHVSLPVSIDLPRITCNGDLKQVIKGTSSCYNVDFGSGQNPKNPIPYVAVYIDAPGYSTRIAARHIKPDRTLNTVSFSYTQVENNKLGSVETSFFKFVSGKNTLDKIVNINSLASGVLPKATVSVLFDFKSPVKNFYLWGVDLNVQKEGFDLKRYS
ncbi:MAG: hypothetical protein Q7R47_02220, partial [Candidatus Diapherotrites archaeon]|nr:hypothetical protein [Candidatus Diapherotrites archaeon]